MLPNQYEPGLKLDRQYGETLEKIRLDHLKRYFFAAERIKVGSTVLDAACGCGYGSWILHGQGMKVTSIDIEPEAIEYGKKHYQGPEYLCQKAEDTNGSFDVLVSFETLEHLEQPEILLKAVKATRLFASVPNEERMPFKSFRFEADKYPHRRHYTPSEFSSLIESCGYRVVEKFSQKDKRGDIFHGTNGIFLIYVCERILGANQIPKNNPEWA